MHIVHIKASKKQLSKLRNGHKVRISPAIEGQGFNLIIDPARFNTVSKTFNKGKGTTIQLSPAEITANQEQAPQMQGQGIFGRKFDDFVRDTIGTKAKDVIYNAADTLKPAIKQGIDRLAERAPEAAAAALATLATASGNPELAPIAATFGHRIGKTLASKADIAKDYFDNPEKYQKSVKKIVSSNVGGPRNRIAPATLQGQAKQNELFQDLNKELGTHYGNLARATLDNAIAHMERSGVASIRENGGSEQASGGQGLYLSNSGGRGLHRKREKGSIGRGSSLVASQAHLPPALVSQPFSANFQFQHTLPPAYAKFSKGGGLSL